MLFEVFTAAAAASAQPRLPQVQTPQPPPVMSPLAPAPPPHASDLNWQICVSRRSAYTLDRRLVACNVLIESGRLMRTSLAMAYVCRGLVHWERKDMAASLADTEAAVRADPAYALAYNNRGFLRYRAEDLEGAAADLETALRLDPNLMLSFLNRGRLRLDRGDEAGAIDDLSKAIVRSNDRRSDVYRFRAEAYEKIGDRPRAIADSLSALRIEPEHEAARRSLCKLVRANRSDALERREACRPPP